MTPENYERMEDGSGGVLRASSFSRRSLKLGGGFFLLGVGLTACSLAAFRGGFSSVGGQSSSLAEVDKEVVVSLLKGSVRGLDTTSQGRRFRGIPYGHAARFTNPVPAEEITGELDARSFSGSCVRGDSYKSEVTSEDCLHLNIFTPNFPDYDTKLKVPVIVWFHGGSFTMGAGSDSHVEDVEELVNTRRLIVVTINYRLGIFGFLGSETLRRSAQDSVGNFGTLDQQMALKWVNQNIEYFGGDPNNIALLGWSAGAASVSCHLTMPTSEGLFQKGIMMSGGFTDWAAQSMADAETDYKDILVATGCDKSQDCLEPGPPCDCLLGKTAAELVEAQGKVPAVWAPTVDGTHLAKHPLDALNAGESHKGVPIIIGGGMEDALNDIGASATEADLDRLFTIPVANGGLGLPKSKIAAAKKIYLQDLPAPTANGLDRWSPAYWAYRRADADKTMNCVARRAAMQWQAKTGAEAYWYVWANQPAERYPDPPQSPVPAQLGGCWPCPGVTHGADIPFLFERSDADVVDDDSVNLADLYQVFFRNLVYDGNPNSWKGAILSSPDRHSGTLTEVWPPMPKGGMKFDTGHGVIRAHAHLKSVACDFWDDLDMKH